MSTFEEDVDVVGIDGLDEEEKETAEEFFGVLESAFERLESVEDINFIDKELELLSGYKGSVSGEAGERIDNVAKLSSEIHEYVQNSGGSDQVSVKDVLSPIEMQGEVEYNGLAEEEVYGDLGLCMVSNTLALNSMDHGGTENIWAEVEELEDEYRIGVWDDGPGLPEDYTEEEIFDKGNGDNSGLGLYLASELTELFEGSLEYSEDYASCEDGFGLEWRLRKGSESLVDSGTQYLTSESA